MRQIHHLTMRQFTHSKKIWPRSARTECVSWLGSILFGDDLALSRKSNFRIFQIERVVRRQFQIKWKWQKVLQMGRKHYRKRRNYLFLAISPFWQFVSKDLHCRHIKIRACLGKNVSHTFKEHGLFIWFLLTIYHFVIQKKLLYFFFFISMSKVFINAVWFSGWKLIVKLYCT